jgi:hypothetical protein
MSNSYLINQYADNLLDENEIDNYMNLNEISVD